MLDSCYRSLEAAVEGVVRRYVRRIPLLCSWLSLTCVRPSLARSLARSLAPVLSKPHAPPLLLAQSHMRASLSLSFAPVLLQPYAPPLLLAQSHMRASLARSLARSCVTEAACPSSAPVAV